MATKVGEIYYDVTLDTKKMVDEQRKVDRELKRTSGSLDAFGGKVTAIASAVGVLAAALAAVKVARLADEFRLLGARVEVAAGNVEAGSVAFAELVAISRRTQSSLEGNIEVFNRLNQSILQMGGTQADTLQVTELLAKAIKVSGANAVEAKAAMLQFGQALGSGKLQGDELRSLMENAPYLMRQLADGIGVPVGALKKLGEEGKLTADVVTNALTKAAAKIDADFRKLPQTFEAALVVAQDQAALASLKLDELTGSSAALAGIAKGLGDVLEKLADQLGALNSESGSLQRNDAIKSWSESTRIALSYVVDAADMTWQTLSVLGRNVAFVFKGIGTEIGGIAAQAAAVARGDFKGAAAIGDAMKADAEQRRKELDAADARALTRTKLFGQQMREAWEQGAGGGRGFVNPSMPGGKLKAPAGVDKPSKFDSEGYLAGLEKATAEGYERINLIEEEAYRKNQELLKAGKISKLEAERAITLIEANAAKERSDLSLKYAGERYEYLVKAWEQETELVKRQEEERARGRGMAQDIIVGGDPIARLQMELQEKSELLLQAFMRDQANEQLYAQARVSLEQQTTDKIRDIRERQAADQAQLQSQQLQAYGSLFGGIADLTKNFAGKQSGAYKAMFAASKAFAIADSIIKIQQGIAGAAALPFPSNLPAIGSVIAATSSIISTISGAQYGGGRQYGGPVSQGKFYKVNETGKPEMFTASNGAQYMMPTKGGDVTPAGDVGAGGIQVLVQITNNHPTAQVTAQADESGRIVKIAVSEVANQIATNSGPVWSAMKGASNIRTAGI